MTKEEVKELLTEMGYEDSITFEDPSYHTAIIGVTESGQICYGYDKMIEFLVNEDKMTEEEAAEFIDYNTIRSLPYCIGTRPIILYKLDLS